MPFAIGDNYRLAVNAETVWGTPVATGAKYLRITGADLGTDPQTTESEEINASHRETADIIRTKISGGGTIDGEMSYLTYEELFTSLFGAAPTGTTVRTWKVGQTLKSVTLQEEFADLSGTKFASYPGALVTGWTLNVANGQIITTNFSVASKKAVLATATAIGTPAAANTNAVMDPIGSVQVLTENGASITGAASFSLSVTNDLIEIPNLLSADPAALYQGKFKVTGTMAINKQDAALMTKYLADTRTTLALTIGGASTKRIALTMAKVALTRARGPVRKSSPITETFQFTAYFDATDGTLKLVATD